MSWRIVLLLWVSYEMLPILYSLALVHAGMYMVMKADNGVDCIDLKSCIIISVCFCLKCVMSMCICCGSLNSHQNPKTGRFQWSALYIKVRITFHSMHHCLPDQICHVFLSYTTLSCSADVVQLTVSARPDAFEFRLQNPKSETAGVAGRATYKVITHITGFLILIVFAHYRYICYKLHKVPVLSNSCPCYAGLQMRLLEEDKPFTDTLAIKSSITGASRTLFLMFIMSAWITILSSCRPSPFHLCIWINVHPCQWPTMEQRLCQSPCAFAVPKFQMHNRPVWACAVPAWCTYAYESMYQAIPAPSAWHVAVIGQLFWNFGTIIVSMPMHPHCLKVPKFAGAFKLCLTLTSFKHEKWTDDGLKVQVNGWSFRSFIKQGSHR